MNTENNLIFLISQPRAGSTLLQRMLGSHPDIHTTSEPWVMLHPLYSMKATGIETEYSSDLAVKGVKDFLSNIENGPTEYRLRMKEMYLSLYKKILEPTGKKFYLDKTPRYYFIINELHELFPEARFVFLFRNPLAVMASIIDAWIKSYWSRLGEFRSDLLYAPDHLLSGLDCLAGKALAAKYEEILSAPERELKKICEHIGISYKNEIVDYGASDQPQWQYGDRSTVYQKSRPDPGHAEKWVASLEDPQAWRVMREYLDYLGKERISKMGYSFNELDSILNKNKPDVEIEKKTISLFSLTGGTRDDLIKRLRAQVKQKDEFLKQKNEQRKQDIKQRDQQVKQRDQQVKQKDQQVKQKDQEIKQKDQEIKQKDQEIKQKDQQIKQKDQEIKQKDQEIKQKDQEIISVYESWSYAIGHIVLWPLKKVFGK